MFNEFEKASMKEVDGDKVTLLTPSEAERLDKDILGCGEFWWLRMPRTHASNAPYISPSGVIINHGYPTTLGNIGVRPALWINLGS